MISFAPIQYGIIRTARQYAYRLALFFAALYCASAFTACLPTDPPLDTSGELIITDRVIGTGATISVDTTIVTQIDIVLSERLLNGTITQSSVATKVLVDNLSIIPGLDKGLRGMRVGGERTITIPPRLAYGNRQERNIPPNSTVIYDAKLTNTELFVIEDITVGTGTEAKFGNTANVRYVGRLTNNIIFDATTAGAEPFSFRLGAGSVIRGWDVGVLGMKVGGKRRLRIPSLLGYGSRAQGSIPPNSTLIFEIELVSVF